MNGYHPTMANYISNNPLVANLESKIRSLCKLGRLQQVLNTIIHSNLPFESSLYIPILQLCINTKSEKEGRLLHNHLKTNNSISNRYLNTKWIIFYAKIGDIETARKVFDEMPERNVVSWTAMISGYCQNGYCRKGLEVFREMRKGGVEANGFTYGSVLKGCTSMMGLEIGRGIHGCVVKSRFCEDLFVQSALVDLYSKCGRMEDGRCVFEMMEKRDVVCWNAVIGGYAVQGYSEDSFSMFRLMLREGLMPDQFSFGSVLKASGYGRLLMTVLNIHGLVVRLGFQSHIVVTGSLIDAYAKCGNVKSARLLYDLTQLKDLISCTALITGYAHEGRNSKDALEVFSELYQMNTGMDNVVLCSMLNICANIASLSLGSQIHALALKGQYEFDLAIGNALIDMYAKSGEIEDAYRAFNEMEVKNVVSWTSLIAGYGKHGYGEKAIALFDEMEVNGLKPNDVTFLSVLFACSHTGMTDEGWKCFMSMVNGYSITPRPEHYSCMIDLLARAGQLEQAFNLLCEKKCKPSASLWSAILGAAKTYRLLSVGKEAAMHLFELEPENAANYILLASIYSEAGLWEEAANIRKLMQQRKTKKDPARSLVQCNVKPVL